MKVLLVDDQIEILEDKSKMIQELGYECVVADNLKKAYKKLYDEFPDIILTDLKLPDGEGISLLQKVREMDESIPVILITGYATTQSAVECMQKGAYDYLEKPLLLAQLKSVLQRASDHRKCNQGHCPHANTCHTSEYCMDGIVGKSQVMLKLIQKVCHVSQTDATVLIYGESGTGKELIAKAIHTLSKRKDKPFIPVDCSTLPTNLMESELFGYERGAFTGATCRKAGVIEAAQGGSLFLDEVTELDPHLQTKLLRFLQERQIRRVGGHETIAIDLRIIAATNDNPQNAVRQKRLREDLYYRLNVVPLEMPPLRERKQDIPLLVRHFINKYAPTSSYEIAGITPEAMQCLKRHEWPGNVRELQNVIEQAISLMTHQMIDTSDLPEELYLFPNLEIQQSGSAKKYKDFKEIYFKHAGRQYFENLLKRCHGNISETARLAGVSRRTIYRLFEDFGVNS
ncbi:sigma-54-dependent Fis family transcriptional regulator [candidate division KSB1 bacterium]|nr:sigma-54-dependent Fis family transcriptional regulator [candidate division KSB1 bacterium]